MFTLTRLYNKKHLLKSVLSSQKVVVAGIFSANKVLLRKQMELGDTPEKWELPSCQINIGTLDGNHIDTVTSIIDNALREEICMGLNPIINNQMVMIPIWFKKGGENELSFIIPFQCNILELSAVPGKFFASFVDGTVRNMVGFFSKKDALLLPLTSPNMEFMITESFRYYKL